MMGRFSNQMFPDSATFNLAIGLFAFNLTVLCMVVLVAALNGMPNPMTHLSGVGRLEDAKIMLGLFGLWSIGNSILLLGLHDALRSAERPA